MNSRSPFPSRFSLFLLLILSLLVVVARPAAAEDPLAKIEPELWQTVQRDGQAGFFAVLKEQADVSSAAALPTKLAKGEFVYRTLRETAERTQAGLRAYLDANGVAYRPFYVANLIYVKAAGEDVLLEIASRPEVREVILNRTYQAINPIIDEAAAGQTEATPTTTEWNVSFINADDVWTQYGVTGYGAVVGDLDTGVDWDHPALINAYRGWNGASADHNYNWWDATTGGANDVPYDDHSHGTHTTGTAVGYDPGIDLHIGVAPDAEWIACKNMNSGGSGIDAWFLECFEFALAPWDLNGQNPDPARAPDVLNNSWGYFGGGVTTFYTVIQNLRDAGVMTEVSAGNEGSGCSSLRSPADYDNVFTTGATANRSETLVYFSSRGPSSLFPDIKPDIVAPGEGINSSLPGGGYSGETWSGTSMAGPHVVGAVALIVSANPGLRGDVDYIEQLIRDTAYQGMPNPTDPDSCGGTQYNVVPNHIYGWGRLDVLAAVSLVASSGHLEGFVRDQSTSNGIPGAVVSLNNGQSFTTDATGYYTGTVAAGTYDVTAAAFGWQSQTVSGIVVVEDQNSTQNFSLARAPRYTVLGRTYDANTNQSVGAHIEIQLSGVPVAATDSDPGSGRFRLRVYEGTYEMVVTAAGYSTAQSTINVFGNQRLPVPLQASWQLGADTSFEYWRFDGEYFDSGAGQSYDQKVYFLGGRLSSGNTDGIIWSYDPLTGVYAQTGRTMPVPISNYTVNLLQDSAGWGLYVFGGRDNAGGMRREVQVYYPATNTTATITTDPLPGAGRISGGTVVVGNKVYVFGGFDGAQTYAQSYVFDPLAPASTRWTTLANLSQGRGYILAAAVDGKIYAMGGDTYDGVNLYAQVTTEVFDTANPGAGWNNAAVAEMPIACDQAQTFGFDSDAGHGFAGKVVTAGCGQWPAETADSLTYTVSTDTWDSSFPDLNQARRNHAGAYIPIGSLPGLWVFGGRQGSDTTILRSTEYYVLNAP
ncbi:MAG: S8 family serine peptidase [Chloroflexota bacterium]